MSFKPCIFGSALLFALAFTSGCGKKTDTSATSPAIPTNSVEAAPGATPGGDTARQQNPAMSVSQRSIDYLQGLIQRKQYPQARQALANLESQQLTPSQQQTVQKLKSQIPPQ